MTIQTLRPDGVAQNDGWANVGGAASINAALADGTEAAPNDATFTEDQTGAASNKSLILNLGTYVIPATSRVKQVQLKHRIRPDDSTDATYFYFRDGVSGSTYVLGNRFGTGAGTWFWEDGGWRLEAPDMGVWTQAAVDALQVYYQTLNGYHGSFEVSTVIVELDVNAAPAVVVTGPAEAGTIGTSRPTVTWTYSDADGDPQSGYRVKIFSAAQYGAGGFNPETSTPTYDSGQLSGTNTSHAITVDLLSGTTYRAYVKVRHAWPDSRGPFESAWDNNQFTVMLAAPPAPTIAAVAQPTTLGGRIELTVTKGTPDSPTADYYLVEYSDDAGATWATVRSGAQLSSAGASTILYDYEARSGVARTYRAKSVDTGAGQVVASAPSATSAATLTLTSWTLKDPLDASRNLSNVPVKKPFDVIRPESGEAFDPLGRATAIVVSDSVTGGERLTVRIPVYRGADENAVRLLLDSQRTLLLQSTWDQWYVKTVGDLASREIAPGKRMIEVSFAETTAP